MAHRYLQGMQGGVRARFVGGFLRAIISRQSLPCRNNSSSIRVLQRMSGFYPTVTVSAWPSGKKQQIESSLVFGGRQRSNDVAINTGYGIQRIDVSYGNSKQSRKTEAHQFSPILCRAVCPKVRKRSSRIADTCPL